MIKLDSSSEPPVLDCLPQSSPDESDASAMPQLELQNSVFDGGGAEGRDVLPHLSPQLWPPSNSVAYRRHFGGSQEQPQSQEVHQTDTVPPPLLLGGKTMVWTSRTPPSSTVTSPTPKKTTPKLSPPSSSTPYDVSIQPVTFYQVVNLLWPMISKDQGLTLFTKYKFNNVIP